MICVAIETTKVNSVLELLCEGSANLPVWAADREGDFLLHPLICANIYVLASFGSLPHNKLLFKSPPPPSSFSSLVYRQISSSHLHHTLYFPKGALISTDSYLIALAFLWIAMLLCVRRLRPPQSYYHNAGSPLHCVVFDSVSLIVHWL